MNPQSAPATSRRRRGLTALAIAAAAVVPLAFAGLTIASMSDADNGLDRIPAAIVNNDKMITQTDADGNESIVLAGRLLVTELTGDDSPGLDWQLLDEEHAADALARGDVYAVLTIPSDFSASVLSLSGTSPERAQLSLQTDDAHSYLAGSVAQSLGDGLVATLGSDLTKQYIEGIYTQFGTVGAAFTEAADGAQQLADGAHTAATGAAEFSDGLGTYTSGVAKLSSGLQTMSAQTSQLGALGAGVSDYTAGVTQASGGLTQLLGVMTADARLMADPAFQAYVGQLQGLNTGLGALSANGPALAQGTAGLGSLATGIAQSASGASALAGNGPTLTTGAASLSTGIAELATGTTTLATGLADGADSMSGSTENLDTTAADVAAKPVGLEVTTANPISSLGQAIGTYFVPLGLWAGALAIFLVLAPLGQRLLASTASTGHLLRRTLGRASAIAAVQALLLVALLHGVAGVSWALLPATVAFSLLTAVAFTAFHQLMTAWLGRAGLIVSILLLAVQVATVGGILPSQALAGPFTTLAGLMPLGWAAAGFQAILAGGSVATGIGASAALLALAGVSVAATWAVIARSRRADALGMLVPATA